MKKQKPRDPEFEEALVASTNVFLKPYREEIKKALSERIKEIIGHEPSKEEMKEHGATGTPINDSEAIKVFLWDQQEVLRIRLLMDGKKIKGVQCLQCYPKSVIQ